MQLVEGLELEDGLAQADEAAYVDESARKEVGIKLHMGRNRIVRRMFAALGYEVVKLDRVVFAGLTKKDMPRGKWRHLTEKEILFLKKRK
jgi:23S rRNA pseudouridine2605 synthase